MAAVGNIPTYSVQERLHLGRQDAVLLDHKWFEMFLVLSLESTVDLMTELWVNVAQQVFFVTDAGARIWVKDVTVSLKRPRNPEHDFGRNEKDGGFGTEFAEVALVYAYVYMSVCLYKRERELIVHRYR